MSVILENDLENDVTLFQMQDSSADDAGDAAGEFPEGTFAKGVVNGLAASLIIWAVIIYFLMK